MTMSQATYEDMASTLRNAGRPDLVAKLPEALKPKAVLTSKEAAELLCPATTTRGWGILVVADG